ncbi:EAL domain-containing protein [Saccharibacillus sp. CPCC 101409]|uniref:putative bifunctional diguanylate cyclase/phosphodiesterase n=1 Tax=Saccharibacillus sp. CPCC 101409 TaxID=3058041 RepID=UPI0026738A47|nr:EAL domain-containing protein [Saccharibacillus sp. CPCC 101409]MDO3409301.1 EAL domain-containing protein [Saccharibacillus sp. CPCC 101409]
MKRIQIFYGGSLLYLAFYLILFRVFAGQEAAIARIGFLNILPIVCCLGLLAGVIRRSEPRSRLFWRLIAASASAYLLSLLLQMTDMFRGSGWLSSSSLSEFFWMLESLLLFAALLFLVYRRLKKLRLVQAMLDASILMTTVAVLSWSLLIDPLLRHAPQENWMHLLLSLAYPVTDLGNLFLLSLLLFANQSLGTARADVCFLVSVLLLAFGDSVYLYLVINDAYSAASPINIVWTIWILCMTAAGAESLEGEQTKRGAAKSRRFPGRRGWLPRLLPCASLVILFAVVLGELSEFNVMVLGSAVAVLLIIMRQVLMFTENDNLLGRLGQSIEVKDYEANHDPLTGLPNRRLFDLELQSAVERAEQEGRNLALLFFDLDRFKHVNDSLGHTVGDRLLQIVADRLREYLPASGLLARQGGDEFTVLVDPLNGEVEAYRAIAAIEEALRKPIAIGHTVLYVSAGIGAALYPRDGATAGELMQSADMAMHEAKNNRHQKSLFFEPRFAEKLGYKVGLENEMRGAIERGEFSVYYQLQKNIQDCRIVGVEALLRWHHPVLGSISPVEFIPVAEETGMIVEIGEWVMKTACLQQLRWEREGYGSLRMSVNVSPYQFQDELFVEKIIRTLRETGVDAEKITLEVTESLAIRDTDKVVMQLKLLREAGLKLAIDDFGTGYASLKYLRSFEPQLLKIDRFFVEGIDTETTRGDMVRAIIAIGKSLNMEVLAEGVETENQLQYLRAAGCDEVQGYYINRPMPAREVERLLEGKRPPMSGTA